jgi:hypothetical protein
MRSGCLLLFPAITLAVLLPMARTGDGEPAERPMVPKVVLAVHGGAGVLNDKEMSSARSGRPPASALPAAGWRHTARPERLRSLQGDDQGPGQGMTRLGPWCVPGAGRRGSLLRVVRRHEPAPGRAVPP